MKQTAKLFDTDLYVGGFSLEMRGRKNLNVTGCRGIVGYSDEKIVLAIGPENLTVTGSGLLCDSYLSGAVGISGKINSVVFGEGEK